MDVSPSKVLPPQCRENGLWALRLSEEGTTRFTVGLFRVASRTFAVPMMFARKVGKGRAVANGGNRLSTDMENGIDFHIHQRARYTVS